MDEFFEELVRKVRSLDSIEEVLRVRDELCKKYRPKKNPSLVQILIASKGKNVLKSKPSRTGSGVSVIAVMTKPIACKHGKCVYCPGGPSSYFGDVPQSYTGNEPATLRAIRNKFDPYLQVFNRLEQYILLGHYPDKIELIIMGGTFPSFDLKYQDWFVKNCFMAMNDFGRLFIKDKKIDFKKFIDFFELDFKNEIDEKRENRVHDKILRLRKEKSLEKVQKENEDTIIRCVALAIETRPDFCSKKEIKNMLRQGCTRVELGVQTVYDDILDKIERKHKVKDSVEATKLLKDCGFKVGYHIMLNLPGSNCKRDLEMFKILFQDERFKPDALKIYPCMVLRGTKLYNLWKKGKYKALKTEEAASLIFDVKKFIPEYCRIMRIQRDISSKVIEDGVNKSNLRQYVDKMLKEGKFECKCIRCKEVGRKKKIIGKIKLVKRLYDASDRREIFLSFESDNALIGFLRLRFSKKAFVRELHIYSESVPIGRKLKDKFQHKGYGRKLLKEAEEICKDLSYKKVYVISGVGVRNYYRKFDYKKEGFYMVKKL